MMECTVAAINTSSNFVLVIVGLHLAAVVIVNLTPTPKDDEMMSGYTRFLVKLYRLIEVAAGIIGPMVKR